MSDRIEAAIRLSDEAIRLANASVGLSPGDLAQRVAAAMGRVAYPIATVIGLHATNADAWAALAWLTGVMVDRPLMPGEVEAPAAVRDALDEIQRLFEKLAAVGQVARAVQERDERN